MLSHIPYHKPPAQIITNREDRLSHLLSISSNEDFDIGTGIEYHMLNEDSLWGDVDHLVGKQVLLVLRPHLGYQRVQRCSGRFPIFGLNTLHHMCPLNYGEGQIRWLGQVGD